MKYFYFVTKKTVKKILFDMSRFYLLNKQKCCCFQVTWNKCQCEVSCHHFASVSFSNFSQTAAKLGRQVIQNLKWLLGHLCFLIGRDFKNLLVSIHMNFYMADFPMWV